LRGIVLKIDRYGNLITNIRASDAPELFGNDPPPFRIIIGTSEITEIRSHYAQGAPGEVFAIVGSMGFLEISVNRGTAAKQLGIVKGTEVAIRMGGAAAAGS
jgi:S-adenosylmethionine hydrolase